MRFGVVVQIPEEAQTKKNLHPPPLSFQMGLSLSACKEHTQVWRQGKRSEKKSPLRLTEPTWSQSLGEPREISLSNAETSPSVSLLPKTGVGAIKQWEIPPSFPRTSLQGSQFQIMHSRFQYKLRCLKERWISKLSSKQLLMEPRCDWHQMNNKTENIIF